MSPRSREGRSFSNLIGFNPSTVALPGGRAARTRLMRSSLSASLSRASMKMEFNNIPVMRAPDGYGAGPVACPGVTPARIDIARIRSAPR